MTHLAHILIGASLALAPAAALADKPNKHGHDHGFVQVAQGCPPGLAKKNNGCLPPGHAKRIWQRGERIESDYIVIRDPTRYRLDPRQTYWQSGDYIYRVDRETGKVLALIGAISALVN
ncbi:excinuclease ABC subunit A [Paenirhodobacter sp. CAU 1674]|jgi:hypothetical protein|uniref:excinuclease ABC subunit A n=1 Tax=Paenirhodobacter sp. CAU 1674 TaxID=3032596 RepID=UPI0023DAD496|nr:excinuclease ABC subunit A [Paenirhodobacter sp. CAU 1674]MDF2142697.1 excinuclease ABC subunit A [Paenirhodobacter sp. CAU 1674]